MTRRVGNFRGRNQHSGGGADDDDGPAYWRWSTHKLLLATIGATAAATIGIGYPAALFREKVAVLRGAHWSPYVRPNRVAGQQE